MPRTHAPSRSARSQAAFQLWLANVLVGTVVGRAWLFDSPPDLSLWVRCYEALALVSSVAVLALLPGLVFLLVHRSAIRWWEARWRTAAALQAFAGTSFLGILYTDTIVYRLLRYHFNGAILNVALTPGSEDAVHLGWSVWSTVLIYFVGGTLLQYGLWRACLTWLERRERAGLAVPVLLRPRVVFLAFVLPIIGIEKSVYAAADIQGDRALLYASKPLPLYPRVRLGRLLDPGGERLPQLQVLPDDCRLNYPLAAPEIPPDGPRPNLFLLVIDSWRADALTQELTPNLMRFAKGARVFENHVSAGNGTRYGLFSMLYGLHGSYWFPVLAEGCSPVLIDTVRELGYDVRVFSSASMNFPEFLQTAWSDLPREAVVDRFPDAPGFKEAPGWRKDEWVADAFQDWMAERVREQDQRPFFCFVLLDAPHQPYDNPGGPFQPTVDRLDYIELGRTTDGPYLDVLAQRLKNSYHNSVLHADRTAQRLLTSLEQAGELERTVVVVTGDHGEEFQENGFWGHTSNFSPEQVEVPFLMGGPGVEPGRETRPTSHLDLPGSLLELLGADPARRRDYSLGVSLFDPLLERARVMAGWSDLGLWTTDGIFNIPLDEGAQEIEVYDRSWNRLPDVEQRAASQEEALRQMALECLRFLHSPNSG